MKMELDYIQCPIKRREYQRAANAFARQNGWGRATAVSVNDKLTFSVITKTVKYGYRKKSNDQYVPMSYVNICKGKGIYYQSAICEVEMPLID